MKKYFLFVAASILTGVAVLDKILDGSLLMAFVFVGGFICFVYGVVIADGGRKKLE